MCSVGCWRCCPKVALAPVDSEADLYKVRATLGYPGPSAGVVELVDTPDLGSGGGNAVGVQVPPPAPTICRSSDADWELSRALAVSSFDAGRRLLFLLENANGFHHAGY